MILIVAIVMTTTAIVVLLLRAKCVILVKVFQNSVLITLRTDLVPKQKFSVIKIIFKTSHPSDHNPLISLPAEMHLDIL